MYEEYKKNFQKIFEKLSIKYGKLVVFFDFIKMCAISIYNSFAKNREMEKTYLRTIKNYEKDEQLMFPKMFSNLIMMYQTTDDIVDILGPIYEKENMANSHIGQFFTPNYIAELMAEIHVGEKNNIEKIIKENGFLSMCEPTCGSGALIIALVKVLKARGINYQQDLLVIAKDISDICVYITYIQLALYGIPAIVYCGDSISNKSNFKMETPLYFLQYWKFRNAFSKPPTENTNSTKKIIDETILNNFKEIMVKGNNQISLF